jgi:hypothetical protein
MSARELASTVGMTLLTVAGLAVTAALMAHAASTMPPWCAWAPLAGWGVGFVILARLTWQEWRETWRR